MSQNELRQLLGILSGLSEVLAEQQRHILTIETYLSEQRGYDAARFGTLFAEFQTDPQKLEKQPRVARESLAKLLRDFEGPPQ